ncbi:MAG: class I mannose-6-phosphate isomerase [Candidatus Saccharimonadaceae bacterium]
MYDKRPSIKIDGHIIAGWDNIIPFIKLKAENTKVVIIECYTGLHENELIKYFKEIDHSLFIDTRTLFLDENKLISLTESFMTNDVLFGNLTNLSLKDYFDKEKINKIKLNIHVNQGTTIIFGPGALLVSEGDLVIYADMPRWEIQQRMRKSRVKALGIDNSSEPFSFQYKRGYFNDWRILDKHKRSIYPKVDFWLDTVVENEPKLIDKDTFYAGLNKAAVSPFRVMPFFDTAPWGGQWMKEVCNLDKAAVNYGWCFDCVPEENSLLLKVEGIEYEMPSVNLVYLKSKELLGAPVESRFGKEFPIRFDILDTLEGGNLSLQVHPTTQYARDNFGLPYTQDESYYVLDAEENSHVYLGLKKDVNKDEVLNALENAQSGNGNPFDTEKYINKFPAKKHSHFLIPAGTIHCSGANSVVLEISSTPNLFTFKLWDWDRLGLDGKPRPINIERGKEVIQWDRDTDYTHEQLVDKFSVVDEGDGWKEEKTGLHPNEFIETRRHTFTKAVKHYTNDSVNVFNLVDGKEIVVYSESNDFEPFIVHYAETFIVPASVKEYYIKPHGASEGEECMTLKAYVRF